MQQSSVCSTLKTILKQYCIKITGLPHNKTTTNVAQGLTNTPVHVASLTSERVYFYHYRRPGIETEKVLKNGMYTRP